MLTTASGKLCPPVVLPTGARFSAVTERAVPNDTQYNMAKLMYQLPMQNARLSNTIMYDWLNSAYVRYNVMLSERVKLNGSK